MTAAAQKLAKEISKLSVEDMLALHTHLLQSLYAEENAKDLDPAFRADIARRIEEIDSGKIAGSDAFEALKQM